MKRAWGWLALAGAGALGMAGAYEIGGHHDTLFTLLDGQAPPAAATSLSPREHDIVTFCAWLPDLSADLNAATLRMRVFGAGNDWRWGAFSQCSGNHSKLMVASQFYLHALTGSDVAPVREAALRMARGLLQRPAGETQADADLRMCTLGFTMHLLGDTFAHSRLRLRPWDGRDTASKLYETGIGHFEASTEPDYMLRRDAERRRWLSPNDNPADYRGYRWEDWVQALDGLWSRPAGARDLQAMGEEVVKAFRGAGQSQQLTSDKGEDALASRLDAHNPRLPAAPARTASAPDLFDGATWTSCKQQMAAFTRQHQGSLPGLSLDCTQVWSRYVALAHKEFGGNATGAIQPQTGSCQLARKDGQLVAPGLDAQ